MKIFFSNKNLYIIIAVIKRPAIDNSIIHDPYGKRIKLESASPVATSYKSRLNEFCQKFRLSIPSYDTVKQGKGFITTIVFNKKVYQSNSPQPTKKQSEQNAAQVVLHMLNQCPAPATSYQDFVEQCKQLTSQNSITASSSTTTSTASTSSLTSKVHLCFRTHGGHYTYFTAVQSSAFQCVIRSL